MDRVELVDVCCEHTATLVQWSCHPPGKPLKSPLSPGEAPSALLNPARCSSTFCTPPEVPNGQIAQRAALPTSIELSSSILGCSTLTRTIWKALFKRATRGCTAVYIGFSTACLLCPCPVPASLQCHGGPQGFDAIVHEFFEGAGEFGLGFERFGEVSVQGGEGGLSCDWVRVSLGGCRLGTSNSPLPLANLGIASAPVFPYLWLYEDHDRSA